MKFNFIIGGLVLLGVFFTSLIWADTNGVWQFANDTRGGTFGGDEQGFTSNFTFINKVYFQQRLIALQDSNYFIEIGNRSQLNDLATNNISTNQITTSVIKAPPGTNIVIQLG